MNKKYTFSVILRILRGTLLLSIATLLVIAAAVAAALLPPLLLAGIVDRLAAGEPLAFSAALLYFAVIALGGILTSVRESLLIVLGQKITHGLRGEILRK